MSISCIIVSPRRAVQLLIFVASYPARTLYSLRHNNNNRLVGIEDTEALVVALSAVLSPSTQNKKEECGGAEALNARLKAQGERALGAETVAILELLLLARPGA